MLIAIVVGLTLHSQLPWLNQSIDRPTMALLSGVLGILLPNVAQFGRAGEVLTKDDDHQRNTLVGIGLTILVMLLLVWMASSLFK